MTPEKRERLAILQRDEFRSDRQFTKFEADQLDSLRRELAALPEKADDKSTPFTDESRRPQLDGSDWNEMNRAKCREEAAALAAKYGPLFFEAVAGLKR